MLFTVFPRRVLLALMVVVFGMSEMGSHSAPALAAEKLLPADTLMVFSLPDFLQAKKTFQSTPQSQLWNDPAMKAFRDKATENFQSEFLKPLERVLGIQFQDYLNLAQGQLTFALLRSGWNGLSNTTPSWVLLLDTREKGGQLKTNLSNLRKKWTESGKQIRAEQIRGAEFFTLSVTPDELAEPLKKIFPKEVAGGASSEIPQKNAEKKNITLGQVDSLWVIGNSVREIERIAVLQAGGLATTLSEQANFEADKNSVFRNAAGYLWVNARQIIEVLSRQPDAPQPPTKEEGIVPALPPQRLFPAAGLNQLKSISLAYVPHPEGTLIHVFLSIPEAGRQGIFKAFALEAKESAPPPFVPAEVAKFGRWRIDGQKAWNGLEAMFSELIPQSGGSLKFIEEVLKEKDPNFDFKRNLIQNLGNDFISWQKHAVGGAVDSQALPTVTLVAVQNPDQLLASIKTLSNLLPPPANKVNEREFLGRKIYSVSLPSQSLSTPGGADTPLHYTANSGYLVFSTEGSLLEEFLRSGDAAGKSLAQMPGLKEAAEKIGGMNNGYFGYDNQVQSIKKRLEKLKARPDSAAEDLKANSPLSLLGIQSGERKLGTWLDFSLLPDFDRIAAYFSYTVSGGQFSAQGFHLKFFSPNPPGLKR